MDNDGDLDLVLADATRRDGSRGPALLINGWPQHGFADAAEADPGNLLSAIRTDGDASCVVADFTGDGRCDILLAPAGQSPQLIENATPGGHWIQLDLAGKRPQDSKARSNNSAVGARVEVKTGAVFQQFVVGGSSGPVAMAPLRIHAGLGDSATVDWLRIIWPDAVLQAEVEMAANCATVVEEVPRKASSCPYLFAWNGEQFEFVADFGGVGGLGYLVSPGNYAPPDPTEYLPLPNLAPRDGEYVLQSLTPLEEVTYFDEAKLVAVDHPEGTEVQPYEMMAIGVPPPAFEVFCFDRPIEPVRAVDQHGRDVTDWVRTVDRRYAGHNPARSPIPGLGGRALRRVGFRRRSGEPARGRPVGSGAARLGRVRVLRDEFRGQPGGLAGASPDHRSGTRRAVGRIAARSRLSGGREPCDDGRVDRPAAARRPPAASFQQHGIVLGPDLPGPALGAGARQADRSRRTQRGPAFPRLPAGILARRTAPQSVRLQQPRADRGLEADVGPLHAIRRGGRIARTPPTIAS